MWEEKGLERERIFDREIEALEKDKTSAALMAAIITGILGTAFMAGATFAVPARPPQYALCIVLAVPGFLGWILPCFLYKRKARKDTEKIVPLIESKYDEIYEICEKSCSKSRILGHIQLVISPLLFKQFLMASLFGDGPVVHNHNQVRILDGGKPVGDDNAGPVFHDMPGGVLNGLFGAGVHVGGGFVQNQNSGVCHKGPGNGQKLALPLADGLAGAGQNGIVPQGKSLKHISAAADGNGVLKLFIGGLLIAIF